MELKNKNKSLSDCIFDWSFEFEKKLEKRKDEKTIQNYMNVVNQFQNFIEQNRKYDNRNFSCVDHNLIEDYFAYRDYIQKKKTGNELKVSTKRNDKKVLILFFEYIEDENDEGFVFSIKWKKVDLGKLERKEIVYHGEDNIIKFLKYLERNLKKNRNEYSYMISFTFKLALYGGLRASEICNLNISSFGTPYTSKKSKKKFIPLKILGKGKTIFTNPIPYEYVKKEYNYFKRNKTGADILFRSKKELALNRFILYRYIEEITNELGINKKGVHILRRTFATNLGELGVDIRNVQLLMRHTDIKTTGIYMARSQTQMEDAASKL